MSHPRYPNTGQDNEPADFCLKSFYWPIIAPAKWRTASARIAPELRDGFAWADISFAQLRNNSHLRRLAFQTYLSWLLLFMVGLLGFVLLTAQGDRWLPLAFGLELVFLAILSIGVSAPATAALPIITVFALFVACFLPFWNLFLWAYFFGMFVIQIWLGVRFPGPPLRLDRTIAKILFTPLIYMNIVPTSTDNNTVGFKGYPRFLPFSANTLWHASVLHGEYQAV
jgi:hypothetical protein